MTLTDEQSLGESRWPPALALVVFIGFTVAVRLWLPGESAVHVPWLVPTLEAGLLVTLVAGDPARLARRTPWLRRIAMSIVVVLVAAALWATALLVYDLIKGNGVSRSATQLLAAGALVWFGNNLAFAMLYWLLDTGGPLARTHHPIPADFAFPQQLSPEVAPPGWRPVFLDYLYLGFTNATAFSPTDAMPLSVRVKALMLVESVASFLTVGLVAARAVNILG